MTNTSWEATVLREIDEKGSGLTPWEVQYVESIRRLIDAGRTLSERQEEVLGQIHDRRVG